MMVLAAALPVNAQELIYEDIEEVSEAPEFIAGGTGQDVIENDIAADQEIPVYPDTSDMEWPEIPADWYADYEYVLSGTDIVLKNYKKENLAHPASVLVVPATAVIDGTTYNTVLDPVTNDDGWDPDGNGQIAMWYDTNGNYYSQLSALKVEQGVRCAADASYLFAGLYTLHTLDVRGLDTSAATDMSYMFDDVYDVSELDVSGFDTSHVTSMKGMFYRCWNMNRLLLGEFDTSNVTDMSYMFDISGEKFTTLDLKPLETQNVTNMEQMICCANITSIDLTGFDTSKVTNMPHMFYNCQKLTALDLTGFDTSKVTDMHGMFRDMQSIKKTSDIKGLTSLNTSSVQDMSEMFSEMSSLTTVNLNGLDTSNVKNMSRMFFMCRDLKDVNISSLNTGAVTDMSNMFGSDMGLEKLDLKGLDTSAVTNMSGMFGTCSALKELDISTFDTSNVTDMSGMFSHCWPMTSFNIRNFNTSKVTNMSGMFLGCSYLKSLDISNFDTSHVTDFSMVFEDSGLTSMDLTGLDTSAVTNMEMLFYDCKNLQSADISALNTSKVTKMNGMFGNCENLKNVKLAGIDTSACTDFTGMFEKCFALGRVDTGALNVSSAKYITSMFGGCYWMKTLDLRTWNLLADAEAYYLISDSGIKELYLPAGAFASTDMTLNYYGSEEKNNLQTIYYAGTKAQWDALNNKVPENVQMVYEYAGDGPSPHAIEIRPSSLTLTLNNGEYGYLTAYDKTDNEPFYLVAWSSEDPRIATVDNNGGVTPISAGSTRIIALSNEGTSAACDVTVNPGKGKTKPVYSISKLMLDRTSVSLGIGASLTLVPTAISTDGEEALDPEVTFKSSRPDIVSVDPDTGLVSAISRGSAKITATTTDGSGRSASCNVKAGPAAGRITVSQKKNLNRVEAGRSIALKASFEDPKAAVKTVNWSSSDLAVAVVDAKGNVTGISEGTAIITAAPDALASGESGTYSVTVEKASNAKNVDAFTVKMGRDVMVPVDVSPDHPAEHALFVGNSKTLSAYYTENGKNKKLSSKDVVFSSSDSSKLTITPAGKLKVVSGDIYKCAEVYVTCTLLSDPSKKQVFYFTTFDRMKKITLNTTSVKVRQNQTGVLAIVNTSPAYPSVPFVSFQASSDNVRLAVLKAGQTLSDLNESDYKPVNRETGNFVNIDFSKGERIAYTAYGSSGKCVITASSHDGNKTAKCSVTIY